MKYWRSRSKGKIMIKNRSTSRIRCRSRSRNYLQSSYFVTVVVFHNSDLLHIDVDMLITLESLGLMRSVISWVPV